MTKTTNTTKKVSKWTPSEKQAKFLEILGSSSEPLILAEVNAIAGFEFKTGTTNPLITKGLVSAEDTEFDCLIVRADNTKKIVGTTKKRVKAYKLVKASSEN